MDYLTSEYFILKTRQLKNLWNKKIKVSLFFFKFCKIISKFKINLIDYKPNDYNL